MNRIIKIILIYIGFILNISNVYAEYNTNDKIDNNFNTIKYNIKLHTNEGAFQDNNILFNNTGITLPIPTREGYTFTSYTDELGNIYNNTMPNLSTINNKDLYAKWNKNYHTINYYLNDELIFQKNAGYMDSVENIDIQYLLDKYHKFEGWNNYIDKMPDYDINLNANISDCYCKLITGHGPSGNALGLKKLFDTMGYNSTIKNAEANTTEFLVETDYSLTLEEFEELKSYLESNTNYTSYFPYPYLYWLEIKCNNGYVKDLVRYVGNINFE